MATERRNRGIPLPHLKSWREWAKLSGVELAERIDVSSSVISRVELGGNCGWKTARKLAEVFGITLTQLVYHSPARTEEENAQARWEADVPTGKYTPAELRHKMNERAVRENQLHRVVRRRGGREGQKQQERQTALAQWEHKHQDIDVVDQALLEAIAALSVAHAEIQRCKREMAALCAEETAEGEA